MATQYPGGGGTGFATFYDQLTPGLLLNYAIHQDATGLYQTDTYVTASLARGGRNDSNKFCLIAQGWLGLYNPVVFVGFLEIRSDDQIILDLHGNLDPVVRTSANVIASPADHPLQGVIHAALTTG